MNLTRKRQQIIDLLQGAGRALSARAISAELSEIDQATVYRNLDLFVSEGLATKYVFDGTESVYEYAEKNHHHAVCQKCNEVIHLHAPDEKILEVLGLKDFEVSSLEVIVRGKCSLDRV